MRNNYLKSQRFKVCTQNGCAVTTGIWKGGPMCFLNSWRLDSAPLGESSRPQAPGPWGQLLCAVPCWRLLCSPVGATHGAVAALGFLPSALSPHSVCEPHSARLKGHTRPRSPLPQPRVPCFVNRCVPLNSRWTCSASCPWTSST